MKKSRRYLFIIPVFVIVLTGASALVLRHNKSIERYNTVNRPAAIDPDYSGTVIPPNIAPLNFLVQEKGSYYCVRLSSRCGRPIEVFSTSPKIVIPTKAWHKLLDGNRGQELYFDIFVANKPDRWNRFATITNRIACEDMDGYLVYRRFYPTHHLANGRVGIYQRNLAGYDESLILDNGYFKETGCVNCHTFCSNSADKMLMSIRSKVYGNSVLLIEDGVVNKLGIRSTYTSWHPNGRLITYSINNVHQFFHSARNEVRDAIDLDSALAYYIIDLKVAKTSPAFSRKDRLETYPAWSPDGRYLYFCSAPKLWSNLDKLPPERYKEVRYDLLRISYDPNNDQWGRPETVLSAQDCDRSILLPRISPDGRWLLLCMCEYGCFPSFQPSSDLYLVDLEAAEKTGRYEYRRLDINSDQSESWHCWSSNSRWIAFSSKRRNSIFTRLYFSYVDRAGNVYKPILLPQKDPTFYESCLQTYSLPELISRPVAFTGERLGRVVRGAGQIRVELPITMATPKVPPVPADEYQKQQQE